MQRSQDKRTWLLGSGVVALVIGLVGWLGVVNPLLSETSSLKSDTQSTQDENLALQSKVARLEREGHELPTLTTNLAAELAALPYDSGLPALTRQLSSRAAAHYVKLTGITVGAITAVTSGGGATGTTPSTNTAASPSATPSPSTTGTSGTGTTTSTSVVAIPVTVLSTGEAQHQLAFLKALQIDGPRRVLVNSTQLIPLASQLANSIDDSCTMTTQLTVFTAPMTLQQQAQMEKLLRGDVSSP